MFIFFRKCVFSVKALYFEMSLVCFVFVWVGALPVLLYQWFL